MILPHSAALKGLVDRARELPSIVAIGAYGSTASETWSAHSDLDLVVILEEHAPVNSLHFFFFVEGIPVDLNLKQREAWSSGDYGWLPPEAITPLWDPDGLFTGVQPPSASSTDAHQYRYAHRHRLLKLTKWIGSDDEVADLMAAGATHWIAVSWFHARNMRFPGIDQAVAYWRMHEPELIELLTGAALSRRTRLERVTKASEIALAPVGGLWSEGDIHITGWNGPPSAGEIASAKAFLSELLNSADAT
jgi:predicted nucleotidyltransferase